MDEAALDPDPLRQFDLWFAAAGTAGVEVPEAMALATASSDGRPSVRMVLLKQADERGFAFHTNYESRKGRELAANPQAALLFHWRPLGSRLAAWASPQSRPLADRSELERLYADAVARFPGADVPRPSHWGGLRLVPDAYEFWQHADNRLHDRIRYERDGDGWSRERLAP